ncbi:MAG: hypothetical protein WAO71_09660 [Gallionella sp.]
MSDYFFPKLQTATALEPPRVQTTWSTGEVLVVDLGEILRKSAFLAQLLEPEVFARVHVGEHGCCLEWFDSEFGADNVYAWAKEQAGGVSHEMFGGWMYRNKLSLTDAATALGISRRMVSYYRTAHKAIPRSIWLACLGWEATRPKGRQLPYQLPTVNEYAFLQMA